MIKGLEIEILVIFLEMRVWQQEKNPIKGL
jgi:hypothetical protein